MKIINLIRNRLFKNETLSVNEFIKKHKIDEMSEDQMENKLLEIIYSNTGMSWYAQKEKDIAKILMGNHIQDKEKNSNKIETL